MSHFMAASERCACGAALANCGHLTTRPSDAKTLIRASREMRDRAGAAVDAVGGEPWRVTGIGWNNAQGMTYTVKATDQQFGDIRVCEADCEEQAEHIAGMSPAVAFALADWLSMTADHAVGRGTACPSCIDQALTVARAYLNEK